jgi:catechol 2,3-dioxygenase-like lactoylglutathione lyase family enzyme
MAKIRHVAFMINDTPKLRDFYQKGFGFEQCYENPASGAIMVMDGTFNLALLKIREGESEVLGTHRADGGESDQRPGINHFGFVVDSVDEILERVGPDLKHGQNPQDGRPAEMRVEDPWGNKFDLSARGYFGREEVRLPAVRQVVLQVDRPNEVANFYKENLELNEEGRGGDGSVYLGDGLIHMSLLQEGLTNKQGIQYIGIQIDDWDATAERLKDVGHSLPIPQDRDAEVAMRDPEGNVIVLSQRGWDK